MSTPLVSFLLPTYNSASTLGSALDSLADQTEKDHEVVVVDDGSTDGTAALLASRAGRRLRVVRIDHAGLLAALNRGLAECRGRYVARMDADDLCMPDRLERQLEVAEADAGVSVVGTQVEVFSDGEVAEGFRRYVEWQNSLVRHEDICREIYIESPIAHPSALLRREELLALGAYEERGWAEDYDLWLRYHAAGRRFAKVAAPLLRWREHPGRATRTDGRYSVENFLRAKAHYLARGPLQGRDGLMVWGAGRTGRRLSKHLIRAGHEPVCFIDIAPARIGATLRGVPILAARELMPLWRSHQRPILLAAVASRGARALIRDQLAAMGLKEERDFLCVA